MKKLLFLTTFDYPSRFAHPIHGLEMAAAFNNILGNNFLFVINSIKDKALLGNVNFITPFSKYGRTIKKMHMRFIGYFIWLPWFFIKNKNWNNSETLLFLNDPMLIIVSVFWHNFFHYKIIFESHGTYSIFQCFCIFNFADKIIFVTQGLLREAQFKYTDVQKKAMVLPNAVDVERFISEQLTKLDLRSKLHLPTQSFIVGYTGRLKPLGLDKGIYFVLELFSSLPTNVCLLFVGGTKKEIEEYSVFIKEKRIENRIYFIEHVDKNEIPKYTKACDLLMYVPNSCEKFFQAETSPMKIFEYMASERPIIVSDIPTTREVLDESSAFFVTPGDNLKFIELVKYVIDNEEQAQKKALKALKKVKENTWERRANIIINLCE